MIDLRRLVCLIYISTQINLLEQRGVSAFQSHSPLVRIPSFTAAGAGWDRNILQLSQRSGNYGNQKTSKGWTGGGRKIRTVRHSDETDGDGQKPLPGMPTILPTAIFITASVAYWYLLVFGAAAHQGGLWVPDFLPLVPGWPPSDADLAPAIEDSVHFFYISDALDALSPKTGVIGEQPPVLRLAFFNLAEAWVFAFLPILLADRKKLPLPVVLVTWLGALGLTNAFLMPYFAFREIFNSDNKDKGFDKNPLLSKAFGAVASIVVGWAVFQTGTEFNLEKLEEFGNLVVSDRTYLAFAVDLVIFSLTQYFLLTQDSTSQKPIYAVPFVGLIVKLFD